MSQKNLFRAIAMSTTLLVVLGLAGWTGVADAASCPKSHGNCDAGIVISIWTGDPTIPCIIGQNVIEILVNVTCSGQSAPQERELRCSGNSDSIVFTALGYEHTVSLQAGANWGQARTDCSLVKYKRKPV